MKNMKNWKNMNENGYWKNMKKNERKWKIEGKWKIKEYEKMKYEWKWKVKEYEGKGNNERK